MTREFEFILAGRPARSAAPAPITCPYDDAVIATTWWASAEDLERATQAAVEAGPAMRALPAYRRAEILRAVASSLRADRDDVAWTLAGEVGKPTRGRGRRGLPAAGSPPRGAQAGAAAAH